MKNLPFRMVLLLGMTAGRLAATDPSQVSALLPQLTPGRDPEMQLEALHAIATSLDERIPPACLPLLQSPGTSVQRNAARAVGSRWWQIPQEQCGIYVQALQKNLRSGDVQVANMTRRGIGLLTRRYESDMFSRSRNKRWVIYERHGKPCVIDTRDHTEELLGPDRGENFLPSYGNEPIAGACHWHPKQEMVAMDMIIFRRPSLLWVWRPGGGLRAFDLKELSQVLKPAQKRNKDLEYPIHAVSFKAWKGNVLEFTVAYSVRSGSGTEEHDALLGWDSSKNILRVISDKMEP